MKKWLCVIVMTALVAAAPAQVLYDNGPLGTGSFATGGAASPAGSWWSEVQAPGTIAGFGHQLPLPNRIADDFTVPAGSMWSVTNIGFFAYQSGGGPPSTLTTYDVNVWGAAGPGVGVPIWSSGPIPVVPGPAWPGWAPSAGPPPPWPAQPPWPPLPPVGASSFTNLYRIFNASPATNRPIMVTNVPTVGLPPLGGGTYWLDWAVAGSASFSGPWAPQVTIGGLPGKPGANGMQSVGAGGAWALVSDGGVNQDFPFIIVPEPTTLGLLALGLLALRRR